MRDVWEPETSQKIIQTPPNGCGSGLAREGGVSANIYAPETPHSRASPLPQRFCGECRVRKLTIFQPAAGTAEGCDPPFPIGPGCPGEISGSSTKDRSLRQLLQIGRAHV